MTARDGANGLNPPSEVDVVVVEATVSRLTHQSPPDRVPGLWRGARLALGLAESIGAAVGSAVDRRASSAGSTWDVAVGVGLFAGAGISAAGQLATRIVRPVAAAVRHPPLLPAALHPARGIEALARLGRQERAAARQDLDHAVTVLVPSIVERVLDRISLTELVKDNVDIDAIVADVDIDAIVTRLDIDAIAQRLDIGAVIDRIDLVALADEIIEGIDLPEIIRASTGTVASEVVRGVRLQTIDADEAVARIVDRLFLRRRRRATDAPGEPESAGHDAAISAAAPGSPDGTRPQVPT